MEYNTNTYITIAHSTCEALNLGETHRKNNEGTICILEFPQGETIPTEIAEHLIDTYTHQQDLELVATDDWVSERPL
jgi:hypothetical protein